MLSCCLLGAYCRRDKAIQLLTVPCLNQPFVEFVFYQHLELFPLIPETKRRSAGKYAKVTFIYSIILLNLIFTTKTSLHIYQLRAGLGS